MPQRPRRVGSTGALEEGKAGGALQLLQLVYARRQALVYVYVGALHLFAYAAMMTSTSRCGTLPVSHRRMLL